MLTSPPHLRAEPFVRMAPPLAERSRAYWTGGADGQLLIARCDSCATYVHPPRPVCPGCASASVTPTVTPTAVSGRGTVYSYTVSNYQWVATMPPPYVVAEVELAEQPGLIVLTNLVGVEPAEVSVGMAVEVRFVPTGDAHVPVFVPSPNGAA
jgi:uncharacterized protein